MLQSRQRDLFLFELGIGTGLKISTILQLKASDFHGRLSGETIVVYVNRKTFSFTFTDLMCKAFDSFNKAFSLNPDDYLFQGRNNNRPLALSSVSNMVHGWFESAGIEGNFSSQDLKRIGKVLNVQNAGADPADRFTFISPPFKLPVIEGLPTIEAQSVQDKVWESLYTGIINGSLAPGSKLSAVSLSEQFNVSLTPVRMALMRLEAQGLISSPSRKASFVTLLSRRDVLEIYSIRIALEPLALDRALENNSPAAFRSLTDILQSMEITLEPIQIQQLHKQFHTNLYSHANMPLLLTYITGLYDRLNPLYVLYHSELSTSEAAARQKINVQHHKALLSHILKGQKAEAHEYLLEDLKYGLNNISRSFPLNSVSP
jgi:DNA-binding GntR family transcriptional regulator